MNQRVVSEYDPSAIVEVGSLIHHSFEYIVFEIEIALAVAVTVSHGICGGPGFGIVGNLVPNSRVVPPATEYVVIDDAAICLIAKDRSVTDGKLVVVN